MSPALTGAFFLAYFLWIVAWFRKLRPALAQRLGRRLGIPIAPDPALEGLWGSPESASRSSGCVALVADLASTAVALVSPFLLWSSLTALL